MTPFEVLQKVSKAGTWHLCQRSQSLALASSNDTMQLSVTGSKMLRGLPQIDQQMGEGSILHEPDSEGCSQMLSIMENL